MQRLILDGKDLKKPAETGKSEEKKKKAAPSNKARKAATK